MERIALLLMVVFFAAGGQQDKVTGLCMISDARHHPPRVHTSDVELRTTGCEEDGAGCGSSENSNIAWSRWTGITEDDLEHEGAQLSANLHGDAGDLHCTGTVHQEILAGRYEFTPNPAFLRKMTSMGFGDITSRKLEGFLLLDITTEWVQQMKDAGVTDLSVGKMMGMKALGVDLTYIHGLAAAGFPELRSSKLTEMKAVGVTPEKVEEAHALGFQPSESDLIQMCIFKIDRPFIERMKARGLKDLSLQKLIQIKIFKLDEE